jgi:hypothetical protein
MAVRAKFEVQSVTSLKFGTSRAFNVTLHPVMSGSDENRNFFKASPGGKIEVLTVNEEAAVQFEPGKQFYVDFTEAE